MFTAKIKPVIAGKDVMKNVSKGTSEALRLLPELRDTSKMVCTFDQLYHLSIKEDLEYGCIQSQSATRYTKDYNRFFGDIKDVDVRTFKRADFERFLKVNIKLHRLTQKTYKGMLTILYRIFSKAYSLELIDYDIKDVVKKISIPNRMFEPMKPHKEKRAEIFTIAESNKIIDWIENNGTVRDFAILLVFYTGIRVGELATLKPEDVDIEQNILHIRRTEINYKDENGHTVYGVQNHPKTDEGFRDVTVPQKARLVLQYLLANKGSEWLVEEKLKTGEFRRVRTYQYDQRLRRCLCKYVGVRPRGMHKIRGYYGTYLYSKNVSEETLLHNMGHTNIKVFEDYYKGDILEANQRYEEIQRAFG